MRAQRAYLSIILVVTAGLGLSANPVNTEDCRNGTLRIDQCYSRDQLSRPKSDGKSLSQEKRQYRLEQKVVKISKKLNRRVADNPDKTMAGSGSGENLLSLLSLIGGVGGFLFIFIPYIGLLGLLMAIGGLVLGLVSMKREGSNVMNILGVVFGGLTVLLFIVAVIVVASYL